MSDCYFDTASIKSIFDDYTSSLKTSDIIVKIVSSTSFCCNDREKALEVAHEIMSQVSVQDADFKNYVCKDFCYRGMTTDEIFNNYFNTLNNLNDRDEKMYHLHQMYFGLNYYRFRTQVNIKGETSSLYNAFSDYYKEYGSDPTFSEDFLKKEIVKSLEVGGVSPGKAHKFFKKISKEDTLKYSNFMGEDIERLRCIAAANIYRINDGMLNPEQAVSLCTSEPEDLSHLDKYIGDRIRAKETASFLSNLFLVIAVVAAIAIMFATGSVYFEEPSEFLPVVENLFKPGTGASGGLDTNSALAGNIVLYVLSCVFVYVGEKILSCVAYRKYDKYQQEKNSAISVCSIEDDCLADGETDLHCTDEDIEYEDDDEEECSFV